MQGTGGIPTGRGPQPELIQRVDDRPQISRAQGLLLPGTQPLEDVDGFGAQHRAQREPFGEGGDNEAVAARVHEALRDRLHAQAIGVSLDDGGTARRRRERYQGKIVGRECIEVDGQPPAGPGGLICFCRHLWPPQSMRRQLGGTPARGRQP